MELIIESSCEFLIFDFIGATTDVYLQPMDPDKLRQLKRDTEVGAHALSIPPDCNMTSTNHHYFGVSCTRYQE